MQARCQVRLYDTSYNLQAVFDNWRSLQIEHRLGFASTHTLILDRDSRCDLFGLDSIVEVWRRIPDSDWYQEYIGFHRTPGDELSERDQEIYTSWGRGLIDLLNRRGVAYPASGAYTLKSGAADDVMKSFVRQNAGSAATSPPRYTNGVTTGLSVAADVSAGPTWAGRRSGMGLLDVVKELSDLSGVDFDVVQTSGVAFEFRTYYPQRGTDRTLTVTFAPNLGNMLVPIYTDSRTEEVTKVIVLGQGEGSSRRYVIRTSAATADSPWNTVESMQDARQEETLAGLNTAGDALLQKLERKQRFTFQVVQSAAMLYGRDYFVGDKVTAKFRNVSVTKKIVAATINIAEGKEEINVEFDED